MSNPNPRGWIMLTLDAEAATDLLNKLEIYRSGR